MLALAAGSFAQKGAGKAKKAPAQPRAAGQGKNGQPKRNIVDRFNRMPPEERNKALAKLPPERRDRIEQQLGQYKNLSPDERRQLRSRYQMFNQLPPEKQNRARKLFQQFGQLPEERQKPLREEFASLRGMSEPDRRARINSEEFRKKYSGREQKFLNELSGVLSPAN